MIECYSSQQLRARKDHKCTLCKQTIRKGQEYISVSYRDEKFRRDKYHIHCDALISAYMDGGFAKSEGIVKSSGRATNFAEGQSFLPGLNCEPEGFCVEDVEDWAAEKGCTGCDKWEDACETIPLACERVLTKALKPNIAAPALESLSAFAKSAGIVKCSPRGANFAAGKVSFGRAKENKP